MKKPANKRPLKEDADYDFGYSDKSRNAQFEIDAFDFKGRADMKVRPTGKYADNAMYDYSRLNEDEDDSVLDRLQEMLERADVSKDEMRSGVRLTDKGKHKVAAGLGVSFEEVDVLLNSLKDRMQRDDDALASAYAEALKEGGDEQLDEDDDGDPDFRKEMEAKSDRGSYNFPWKDGGRSGTATAEYRWMGDTLDLNVMHIRDAAGDPVKDAGLASRLEGVARGFIGKE